MTTQQAKAPSASLQEVNASVPLPKNASFWRRLLTFAGPAYMVSVGYMDPGNWSTDLQGGAQFGYTLIWVLVMSNLMAVLLQPLSARLGIVTGKDLAQACRDYYPKPVAIALWVLCEIAIAACDLAEVLGSAVGLKLIFGIPILAGVLITSLDVLLLLGLQRIGIRKMEALILMLVFTIGACFIVEIFLAKPDWGGVAGGFIPTRLSGEALFISVGIIGATVMPHNLYLHSALVQTRQVGKTEEDKRQACKFNLIDSVVALNCAFFVNAAILVLAAAAFNRTGHTEVGKLEEAHSLLAPLLGTAVAGFAFALALLCSGQSSTLTGTLAGQIVMEGFLNLRIPPWLRRLVTRCLAIGPAALVIWIQGDSGVDSLLVLSQVALSLQLPFAVIPLIQFTGDRTKMGVFASSTFFKIVAWITATVILSLNAFLIYQVITGTNENPPAEPLWVTAPYLFWLLLVPVLAGTLTLLVWLILSPWYKRMRGEKAAFTADQSLPAAPAENYRRVGVALEVGPADEMTLRHATALATRNKSSLVLMHVVEGVAAQVFGNAAEDREASQDKAYLEQLAAKLREQGYEVGVRVGYGDPAIELPKLVAECGLDLLIIGSHGHGPVFDLLRGSTVDPVRHRVSIPVLVIRS
ncbi:MAG: Nramp family divalent metal transporter [Planctomycetes bacterium]|nr:Nramp family divalent metal transporter [Planctomycetota bacterium]